MSLYGKKNLENGIKSQRGCFTFQIEPFSGPQSIAGKDGLIIWMSVKNMGNGLNVRTLLYSNMFVKAVKNGQKSFLCWMIPALSTWLRIDLTPSSIKIKQTKNKRKMILPKGFTSSCLKAYKAIRLMTQNLLLLKNKEQWFKTKFKLS